MPSSSSLEREALDLFAEALDLPEAGRAAFIDDRAGHDPKLKSRLIALLEADSAPAGALRTGGAGDDFLDGPMPERIGAYRVIRLIGEGGMGAVYFAERDAGDFEHRAAVKLIRPGVLAPELVERFFSERQLLARLNHPNIARLFDGGETPDGAPYIVMEYIDGDPLLDWAGRAAPSLTRRLDLFDEICLAVGHAHKNLIIHRDITPANVLVTHDGVAKLIDFGISRPDTLAQPGAATGDSLSFTPGYAAPERQAGLEGNTLSDIYSLGRLLNDLTANQPRSGELAALIARASAPAPDQRYQSVDALRDDLSRLIENRPLAAYRGGPFYPLRKLFARRRLAMSAGALALVGLLTALSATTLLYNRAEAERRAADQRFEDVRSLAGFMIFDLYDELQQTPGNTSSIALLAEEAQAYLDSLSQDPRASLDVSLEAVRGYKRLADILGNPDNANLGLRATAGEMLLKALEDAEAIHARFPDNRAAMRALGEVAFANSTHAYVAEDDAERALVTASLAADIYDRLAALPDATFDDRRQRLRAHLMTAVPLPWIGRHQEGIDILAATIGEAQALVEAYPGEPEAKHLLGSLNVEMARAMSRYSSILDEPLDILPYWDEAVRLRLESYAGDPSNQRPYRSLVTIFYERGAHHRSIGNFDEAYADALRTRDIATELLAADPDDNWLKRMYGGVQDEIARTLSYAGRHDEAVVQARLSLPLQRSDYERQPDNRGTAREWAYSQVLLGEVFLRAGELEEGCPLIAESRRVWDELATDHPLSQNDMDVSLASLTTAEAACAGQIDLASFGEAEP